MIVTNNLFHSQKNIIQFYYNSFDTFMRILYTIYSVILNIYLYIIFSRKWTYTTSKKTLTY